MLLRKQFRRRIVGGGGGGTLNWLTWSDHYSTDQLAKVAASTKITGRPKLFSDNADAFLQLKQTGPQFDQVSADALWVKKYMESGLIQPFDLSSIGASSELYSMAKNFDFLNDPKGRHRIPVLVVHRSDLLQPGQGQDAADDLGITDRSPIQGPDRRREHPDRPDGDRRNRHRFQVSVRADRRSDLDGGRLAVIAQAEHDQARDAEQRDHLDDGQWRSRDRLHQPGHRHPRRRTRVAPSCKSAYPPEGTIGFIDSEMITAKGNNQALVKPFLDAMQRSEFIVENFTTNWRPLFNEKAAKALTSDPKTADSRQAAVHGQSGQGAEHDPEGPGPGSAGLHRGVQPGLRGLT